MDHAGVEDFAVYRSPGTLPEPGDKEVRFGTIVVRAPQSDSRLPRLPDGSPTRFSLSRDSGTRVDRQMSATPRAARLISVIAGLQFQPVIHPGALTQPAMPRISRARL